MASARQATFTPLTRGTPEPDSITDAPPMKVSSSFRRRAQPARGSGAPSPGREVSVVMPGEDPGQRIRREHARRDTAVGRHITTALRRRSSFGSRAPRQSDAHSDAGAGGGFESEVLQADPQLRWRLRRLFYVCCSHGPCLQQMRLRRYQWEVLCQEAELEGPGPGGGWAGTVSQGFLDTVWSATSRPDEELVLESFAIALGAIALRRCTAPPATGADDAGAAEARALRVLWDESLARVADRHTVQAAPVIGASADPLSCRWPYYALGVVNCALSAAMPLLRTIWRHYSRPVLPRRQQSVLASGEEPAPPTESIEEEEETDTLLMCMPDWKAMLNQLCPDLLSRIDAIHVFHSAAGLEPYHESDDEDETAGPSFHVTWGSEAYAQIMAEQQARRTERREAAAAAGLQLDGLAAALVIGAVAGYARNPMLVTVQSRVVHLFDKLARQWRHMLPPEQRDRLVKAGDTCRLAAGADPAAHVLRHSDLGRCSAFRAAGFTEDGWFCVLLDSARDPFALVDEDSESCMRIVQPTPGAAFAWVQAVGQSVDVQDAGNEEAALIKLKIQSDMRVRPEESAAAVRRGLPGEVFTVVAAALVGSHHVAPAWRPAHDFEVAPGCCAFDPAVPEFERRCPFQESRRAGPRLCPPPPIVPVPTSIRPARGSIDPRLVQPVSVRGTHFLWGRDKNGDALTVKRELEDILHSGGDPLSQRQRRMSRRMSRSGTVIDDAARRASAVGRSILRRVSVLCGDRPAPGTGPDGAEVSSGWAASLPAGGGEPWLRFGEAPPVRGEMVDGSTLTATPPNLADNSSLRLLASVVPSVREAGSWAVVLMWRHAVPVEVSADGQTYSTDSGLRFTYEDRYPPLLLPAEAMQQLRELHGSSEYATATLSDGSPVIGTQGWHRFKLDYNLTPPSRLPFGLPPDPTAPRPNGCDYIFAHAAAPLQLLTATSTTMTRTRGDVTEVVTEGTVQGRPLYHPCHGGRAAVGLTFSGFLLVLVWCMLGQRRVMNPVVALSRLLRRKGDRKEVLRQLALSEGAEDDGFSDKLPCVEKWLGSIAGGMAARATQLQTLRCPKGGALRPRTAGDKQQKGVLACTACRSIALPREVYRAAKDGRWSLCPRCYGRLAGMPNYLTERVTAAANFYLGFESRHDVVTGKVEGGPDPPDPAEGDLLLGGRETTTADLQQGDGRPDAPALLLFERQHDDGGDDLTPEALTMAAALRHHALAGPKGRRVIRVGDEANTHVVVRGLPHGFRARDAARMIELLGPAAEGAVHQVAPNNTGTGAELHIYWPPRLGVKGRERAERAVSILRGRCVGPQQADFIPHWEYPCEQHFAQAVWGRFHHQVARGGRPAPPDHPLPPQRARRPREPCSDDSGSDQDPAEVGEPASPPPAAPGSPLAAILMHADRVSPPPPQPHPPPGTRPRAPMLTPRSTRPASPDRERELLGLGTVCDPSRELRSKSGAAWSDADREKVVLGPPKTMSAAWR